MVAIAVAAHQGVGATVVANVTLTIITTTPTLMLMQTTAKMQETGKTTSGPGLELTKVRICRICSKNNKTGPRGSTKLGRLGG
jgi:hypothetical protein